MEMAVELIVFLGIGIILLGLVTTFVYEWKFSDNVGALKDIYEGDSGASAAVSVDRTEFIARAADFWDWCNHTYSPKDKVLYVYNNESQKDGTISKKDMFDQYRSLGWCKGIQSAAYSCGNREDINMTTVTLPKVVRVSCRNYTLFIT